MREGEIILVDDGTCPKGQIKRVVGGNHTKVGGSQTNHQNAQLCAALTGVFIDATLTEAGSMFKITLVAAAIAVATPSHAQVRVITGDIEHIYGPGGQLLDDAALQRQNERRESARIEMQREREITRRQEQLLAAEQARQTAQPAPYYEPAQIGYYPVAGRRYIRSSSSRYTIGRRH